MQKILISGSSGNVGQAILKHLQNDADHKVYQSSYQLPLKPDELYFNFDDVRGTEESLKEIDVLFLMRPPHISDTKKYFEPLIAACVRQQIKHIVFLSVQGAEKSSIIPHNRIEKMILSSKIPFTFIRPSYFMQNLTTTLLKDIQKNNMIFLPAGKAKFLWVDVDDIGHAIATVLLNPVKHTNTVYTITGTELLTFQEVADVMTQKLGRKIRYDSPSLLRFYWKKSREGVTPAYIFVMIMLHYLARFETVPVVSSDFTTLTGDHPGTLDEFLARHQRVLREGSGNKIFAAS